MPVPKGWKNVPKNDHLFMYAEPKGVDQAVGLSIKVEEPQDGQSLDDVPYAIVVEYKGNAMSPHNAQYGACRIRPGPCRGVTFTVDPQDHPLRRMQVMVIHVGDRQLEITCEGWESTFARAVEHCDRVLDGLVIREE